MMPKRLTTPDGQRQAHVIAAWAWFGFGCYGLIEYVVEHSFDIHMLDVANSIPILFAISVYANFVGHLSSVQAAQAEVKIDQASEIDAHSVSVNHASSIETSRSDDPG